MAQLLNSLAAQHYPESFNEAVRAHWDVETALYWRLDVVMNEDQDRTRWVTARITSPFPRHGTRRSEKEPIKRGLWGKFQRAGWDNAYLARLLSLI